jgi:hypothetical protein
MQTGAGHFSPVAGYHTETDSCLILDVARFKYPPYWVSVPMLWESMHPHDTATGKSRGYSMLGAKAPCPIWESWKEDQDRQALEYVEGLHHAELASAKSSIAIPRG